jgi:phosphoribosyl 1,2-cyclic phosphate phosphodiesterase
VHSTLSLTFLGTATSVGVPMIGCECPTCLSTDPRDQRLRSSIFIQTPEVAFIVDTGPDFRQQVLRAGIRHLDAILLTHAHTDHIMGFDDVRRFTIPEDARIPIYASAACLADLQTVFAFAFNGENHFLGYLKPVPKPIVGPFSLGELEITPLPVTHGKLETHGYLFSHQGRKLIAYVPDIKTAPASTEALMGDVDILIIDALRWRDHPTHMTFQEAESLARRVRARRTWFTHFQCDVHHATTEPTLPPDIRLAYDTLVLTLPL